MCSFSMKEYQLRTPKTKHKGDLFDTEKQRVGNKRQSQEIEHKGKGEGTRERVKGYLFQRTKDFLWIERRQAWHMGKWQFIKVQE